MLLKLLKFSVKVQKAAMAKRQKPTKMGATPSMILQFIGIATARVLVMTLYWLVFAKYLATQTQCREQPKPMKSSVYERGKKGDMM